MNFIKDINASGTHLQGTILTTYDKLVKVFGEPDFLSKDGDKVTCEWDIQFSDGTIATIYDWKEYETPLHIYDWHIGGKSSDAVDRVREQLS